MTILAVACLSLYRRLVLYRSNRLLLYRILVSSPAYRPIRRGLFRAMLFSLYGLPVYILYLLLGFVLCTVLYILLVVLYYLYRVVSPPDSIV